MVKNIHCFLITTLHFVSVRFASLGCQVDNVLLLFKRKLPVNDFMFANNLLNVLR